LMERNAGQGEHVSVTVPHDGRFVMGDKALQGIVAAEVKRLSEGAPVRATVCEGVVTLSGTVQNDMCRTLIEQELLQLAEVLDVQNHLHVAAPPGDIRTQILALLEHQDVPTAGLKVEENAGAVVLAGEAASWFDRDAAERLAWTVPGVRSVENRVTLPPGAVDPGADAAGNTLA